MPWPRLGPQGGLLVNTRSALEFVARHVVGDRLQRARVERAGDTVTSVGTAIQKRLEVHPGNRAVFFHAGFDMHQARDAGRDDNRKLLRASECTSPGGR